MDEVSEAELVNASAYILFYERKDVLAFRQTQQPQQGATSLHASLYPALGLGQAAEREGEEGAQAGQPSVNHTTNMTAEELDRFLRRREAGGKSCAVQ